jgi:uncharacterized protein YrrD
LILVKEVWTMIIKRSDVVGREIVDRVSGHRLGHASDLMIENLTRRVTGLLYDSASERWFLPRWSVTVFGQDSILVDPPKLPTPGRDVSYVSWREHQIVTRSGNKLGKLDDFYFDSLTGYIGGFVVTNGNRQLLYGEYFESWSPGTITVQDKAERWLENENEWSVRRLVENMKSRTIVGVREFADLLRSLSSRLRADVSAAAKDAGEAVKPVLKQAWTKANESAAKLDRWLEQRAASVRNKTSGWTQRLKRSAQSALSRLTGNTQGGFGNRSFKQS